MHVRGRVQVREEGGRWVGGREGQVREGAGEGGGAV